MTELLTSIINFMLNEISSLLSGLQNDISEKFHRGSTIYKEIKREV